MIKSLFCAALMILLLPAPRTLAQVSLDVSKITCDQFSRYTITDPKNIALWLSGYRRP
jgi:acid stress chaperone HdeB